MENDDSKCNTPVHTECLYGDAIKEIKETTAVIKELLLGNGKIGFLAKVNILWGSSLFIIGGLIIAIIGVILK